MNENRIVQLPNENFDTGRPTRLGEYQMADETYAKLLEHFDGHLNDVSDAMRANILNFYGASGSPESSKAMAVLSALRANSATKTRPRYSGVYMSALLQLF